MRLSEDFLIELCKACIVSKDILEIAKSHFNYSFLPSEGYKIIFKYLFDYHNAYNKSPTIGLVAQNISDPKCTEIIGKVRQVDIYDTKDQIVDTLEQFIKRGRFVTLHKETGQLYNAGKHDQAMVLLEKESKAINEFSLKTQMYSRVFGDFDKRQLHRQNKEESVLSKIPTGIPAFDHHTRGGIDRGTGILGIARSGAGKTTWLRSLGANAAFRGINVLHIAAGDSTSEEIENGYDAWWTGVDLHAIKEGKIGGAEMKQIEKARQAWLAQAGEIYIHVFKQFHSASIADTRNILIELLKKVDIGLVLFDYLELFDPGDGKRYGTNQEGNSARKKATAEKIINIATEFNVATAAVTQASDIQKEDWNNPNFVITRNHISNLKATIDPFAYCVTLNQTEDENDLEIMRIHEEKLRHYKIFSWSSTYHIAQKRDVGRFIDLPNTIGRFWDPVKKEIIRFSPKKKEKI